MQSIFQHIDKRAVIGFSILLALIVGLFFYWLSDTKKESGPLTEVAASPLNATLGRELLEALEKLHSTKLDTSIWDDPVFKSLTDHGVEIAAQPVGRRNPFAPWSGRAPSSGAVAKPSASGAKKTPTAPVAPPKLPSGGFDE